MGAIVSNWKRDIRYTPAILKRVRSIADVVDTVKDSQKYPSPVRVMGSHHSTTKCIVAAGGTVLDFSQFNQILSVDRRAMTITMEPGVLLIDAARHLATLGLQFYVNIELGNLTMGAGACGATKDASYASGGILEYGQVSSYCVGMKVVKADGTILTVDATSPTTPPRLLEMLRGSYGLLGVIAQVTYRVKCRTSMALYHKSYSIDDFVNQLDALIAKNTSMMLYLFPFLDRVVVEYRQDSHSSARPTAWQWRLRNWMWCTGGPWFGRLVGRIVRPSTARSAVLNVFSRLVVLVLSKLRARSTYPTDQIIRYKRTAPFASYTFSIWSFPRSRYKGIIRAYFMFCKEYFRKTGYRCELPNVGYFIAHDKQSIFSYTRDEEGLTLDPVAAGDDRWASFLKEYNKFCSAHGGRPLFNQTPGLTRHQAHRAFAPEIRTFSATRARLDPNDRFYTPFFRNLLT